MGESLPDEWPRLPALHATIDLYEAGEGVQTGLKTMPTPGRPPQTNLFFPVTIEASRTGVSMVLIDC